MLTVPVTQSLNATPSPNATPPQSYRAIVSEWWRECNDADIEPLIKALEDTPCPSCGKLRLYAMNATPPQSHKTIVNKWWIVETDESHDESLGDEPLLTCKSEILLEGAHD